MASASRWLQACAWWGEPRPPAGSVGQALADRIIIKQWKCDIMNNGLNRLKRQERQPPADPDVIAIQALTHIATNPDHAERFMALSGIPLGDLRRAAADAGFLVGVMDYLVGDEALLLGFAAESGLSPEAIVAAHGRLTLR